jgi:hypothetical protein
MSAAQESVVEEILTKQPRTIGEIMARMFEIRKERKEISTKDKALIKEWEGYEETLTAKMKEQGEDFVSISSTLGTATITSTDVANVDDWDAFYAWIKETDSFHLLQRRVASNAFRELHEAGEVVPGVRAVPKKDISLTATA